MHSKILVQYEAMKIVIISNGHGEDAIATNIAESLLKHHPSATIFAYPLVGNGHAYSRLNIPVKIENPIFPSGGFIRSVSDAVNDISHGLLSHIKHQRNVVKNASKDADIVITIGDIFCLWQSRGYKQKTVFFPTAKSDTFMPHSRIEKWLIKSHSALCFPRDEITTQSLKQSGINAHFHGNPMMDNLVDDTPRGNPTDIPLIGVLPGSRDEAYDNLTFIDSLIEKSDIPVSVLAAVSPSLDTSKLAHIKHCTLSHNFKAIINAADVVIGLAGTANEQAAFLNTPVLCFPGFGPQSTALRFQEQQKLMGNNIHFVNSQDHTTLLNELKTLLNQPKQPRPTENQQAANTIASQILDILSLIKG